MCRFTKLLLLIIAAASSCIITVNAKNEDLKNNRKSMLLDDEDGLFFEDSDSLDVLERYGRSTIGSKGKTQNKKGKSSSFDYTEEEFSGSGNDESGNEIPDEDKSRKKLKCLKGEIGEKGEPGPMGPQGIGLKGNKGDSIQGPIGPSGDNGPSGICDCSNNSKGSPDYGRRYIPRGPGRLAGMVVYNNKAELLKIQKYVKPGAIAYVKSEVQFYGRVQEGWAPFVMGQVLQKNSSPNKLNNNSIRLRRRYQPVFQSVQAPAATLLRNSTLRIVALNDPWNGDMKGIDFINYQCQKEAYDSEIKGIFRAFLSSPIDKGVDLISIVKNPNDVIVNLKNDTLFPTWKSIFNRSTKLWNFNTRVNIFSGLPPPTIYSFNGQDVIQGELSEHWEINMAWHGSFEDGTGSFTGSCRSWTSNKTDIRGFATDFLLKHMLDQELIRCNESLMVFCIEVPEFLLGKHFDGHYMTLDEHTLVLERLDKEWGHVKL